MKYKAKYNIKALKRKVADKSAGSVIRFPDTLLVWETA
jgi:hypothetical protein